jgi:fucose permease
MLKIGYRNTALIGAVTLFIGATLFFTLPYVNLPIWAAVGSLFLGSGMGFTTTTFIVSIQSTVDWKMRGTATATNMFMRSLGGAVGVALLGGILNNRIQAYIKNNGVLDTSFDIDIANVLLDPVQNIHLSVEQLNLYQQAFTYAVQGVYTGVYVLVIISIVLIFLLPKEKDEINLRKN